jgi:hypothetical protein
VSLLHSQPVIEAQQQTLQQALALLSARQNAVRHALAAASARSAPAGSAGSGDGDRRARCSSWRRRSSCLHWQWALLCHRIRLSTGSTCSKA